MDGAPFPSDSSIQDFDKERLGNMANAVEQALLLPRYGCALKFEEAWDVSIPKKGFSLGILMPLLSCTHTHIYIHSYLILAYNLGL